jgi:hypothetical protein
LHEIPGVLTGQDSSVGDIENKFYLVTIKSNVHNITSIKVNGNLSCNGQIITETFGKYFVSAAQNNHNANATPNRENPLSYLSRAGMANLFRLVC